MLEIKVRVSEQLLKDKARWLKLRTLLLGEEGGEAGARPGKATLRAAAAAHTAPAEPAQTETESEGRPEAPRLFSNLQKAAYALHRLHEASPNPTGYTAHQMALFLREQNIDALSATQLSWALATMVNSRHKSGKVFARRIRRGRYLPTEHTRELFA